MVNNFFVPICQRYCCTTNQKDNNFYVNDNIHIEITNFPAYLFFYTKNTYGILIAVFSYILHGHYLCF